MATKIDKKIVGYKVLEKAEPQIIDKGPEPTKPLKRPEILNGHTVKIANHAENYNLYMTVNYHENKPFELFFDSSHTESTQWVKGLSRIASALLRSPDENLNMDYLSKQLMMVHSDQGYHTGGKGGYVPGIVHHIGKTLRDLKQPQLQPLVDELDKIEETIEETIEEEIATLKDPAPGQCPDCHNFTLVVNDGCKRCKDKNCGYIGECG